MIWTDSFGEGTTLNKQKRADLLLVMVTFFWGASYYLTDICLADLPPMTLNAFRFIVAFLVLGLIFWKHVVHINRTTLWYSLIVGLALAALYAVISAVRSLLEPKVMAAQAGLPPLASLAAMYAGFRALGVAGMILLPMALLFVKQLHDEGYVGLWK